MNHFNLFCLFLFGAVQLVQAQYSKFSPEQKQTIETFIKQTTGVYNNKQQADTAKSPLLRLSEIRAFRIWTHKKNEYWLSIGWYQPGMPEQPMGEKIFHIKEFEEDKFLVDCYAWKDPSNEKLLLQWRKKHPYRKQRKSDLVNDGCSNFLTINETGAYELKTAEGEICAFNNPMAPFDGLFFHFVYGDKGKKMDIHDKNYKNKQVIFHYVDAPMQMRKVKVAAK